MQDSSNADTNNGVDLRELFSTLWAYKLFIACSCTLGLILGGYHALNAEKEYTSVAIFKLDQAEPVGLSLGGELGAVARLSGLNSQQSNDFVTTDRLYGRIFIKALNARVNLLDDPYFNTYAPDVVEPLWKSTIKRAIGWQNSSNDKTEVIWQGISSKFSTSVLLDERQGGSREISVTHVDAVRAAKIANEIMDEIISIGQKEKKKNSDKRLLYLSNTLAEALSAVELSQSKLKEFALKNSALPLQTFAAGSLELDALREKMSRTSELREAAEALLYLLQIGKINEDDYLSLRKKYPIVDQVEFRRVLGQNEIISSWSWPRVDSVAAVFETLTERKDRLQSQINAAQLDAERSGRALETFAKLEREAKVSEAAYQVLIEQVKAQSVIAGYQPDKSEVYEYAFPAISPSAPKRGLILALGTTLGLFIGVTLSLLLSFWRGVYYSKNSLKTSVRARVTAGVKGLMPFCKKNLNEIDEILIKNSNPVLRVMSVEINKSGASQVAVTSSRSKLKGADMARALATYMQSEDMNAAVIDFSLRDEKRDFTSDRPPIGSFVVTETQFCLSILKPVGDARAVDLIGRKNFWKNIKELNGKFDLLFLCADDLDAISLLSALAGLDVFHISAARTKYTQSKTLLHMHSLLPIQGLLHD